MPTIDKNAAAESQASSLDLSAIANQWNGEGATSFHEAVMNDHLELAKSLFAAGAKFIPDAFGRMPSVIALECEVSDQMFEWVCEEEAKLED